MKGTRSRERAESTTTTLPDWMNMSMADWMGMTPSDWMDQTLTAFDRSYGELLRTRPSDLWSMYRSGMGARQSYRQGEGRRYQSYWEDDDDSYGKKRHHHRGCRRCGSDPCQCYCCIGDVDLALYSLVGEVRVIPLVVENERRRDMQVTLELSGWTTPGGRAAPVETVLLEPKTFTLPSCGEQKVTLVVRVRDPEQGELERAGGDQPAAGTSDAPAANQERRQLPDVDDCLVAAADLRLVGCDHRPLRIAVAILPRHCDPYTVSCGCACC